MFLGEVNVLGLRLIRTTVTLVAALLGSGSKNQFDHYSITQDLL